MANYKSTYYSLEPKAAKELANIKPDLRNGVRLSNTLIGWADTNDATRVRLSDYIALNNNIAFVSCLADKPNFAIYSKAMDSEKAIYGCIISHRDLFLKDDLDHDSRITPLRETLALIEQKLLESKISQIKISVGYMKFDLNKIINGFAKKIVEETSSSHLLGHYHLNKLLTERNYHASQTPQKEIIYQKNLGDPNPTP